MKKQDCENCEDFEKNFEKKFEKFCMSKSHHHGHHHSDGASGAVYGLGFIGALIFFIGNATTFWGGVLGILQAIVWPAYVVYEVLNYFIK